MRGRGDSESGCGGRFQEGFQEGFDAREGLRGGELGALEGGAFYEEFVVCDGELGPGLEDLAGLVKRLV